MLYSKEIQKQISQHVEECQCCVGKNHKGWCQRDGYEAYIEDDEGNKYCIFHAPAKLKRRKTGEEMSEYEFNDLVHQRIQAVINMGDKGKEWDEYQGGWSPRCDFSGTIFITVYFSKFNKDNPIPTVDFSFSQFWGRANFCNSQFHGEAHFINSQFRGDAIFWNLQFWGDAIFSNSQFREKAIFSNSQFEKRLYLKNALLCKASFADTQFRDQTFFDNTAFSEGTDFNRARMEDVTTFDGCCFDSPAKFEQTYFKNWAYFRGTHFDEVSFRGVITDKTILMENADISRMLFAQTNIELFQFVECNWHETVLDKNGHVEEPKERRSVWDERKEKDISKKLQTLEEIYRRLKKVAAANNDQFSASAWHYKEKEMRLNILEANRERQQGSSKNQYELFWPTMKLLGSIIVFLYRSCKAQVLKLVYEKEPDTSYIENIHKAFAEADQMRKPFMLWFMRFYRITCGFNEEPLRAAGFLLALQLVPILSALAMTFAGDINFSISDLSKGFIWHYPFVSIPGFDNDLLYYNAALEANETVRVHQPWGALDPFEVKKAVTHMYRAKTEHTINGFFFFIKALFNFFLVLLSSLFGVSLRNKLRR